MANRRPRAISIEVPFSNQQEAFENNAETQSTIDSLNTWLEHLQTLNDQLPETGPPTEEQQMNLAFFCEQICEMLEAEEAVYMQDANRCPLINLRESFLVAELASLSADQLVDQILSLLLDFIFPQTPPVSLRLRIASARLMGLLLEILPSPDPILSLLSLDHVATCICLEPDMEMQMYQTSILGSALNDRKSYLQPNPVLLPVSLHGDSDQVYLPTVLVKRVVETPVSNNFALECYLKALSFLGEYQEALLPVEEFDLLDKLFSLLKLPETSELVQFHTLEFFSRLLVHKGFIQNFLSRNGIVNLLAAAQHAKRPFFLNPTISACFSCIALVSQSMLEKVFRNEDCLLRLVKFHLELLRGDQDVTQKNALLFLSMSFAFPVFLIQFDLERGCTTLLQLLINPNRNNQRRNISIINLIKHTCKTLRDYFRAHIALTAVFLTNKSAIAANTATANTATTPTVTTTPKASGSQKKRTNSHMHSVPPIPSAHKPLLVDNASHERSLELIQSRKAIEYLSASEWRPIEELKQNNGISLLFGIVSMVSNSRHHHSLNAEETCCLALQILSIVSLFPPMWPYFCSKPIVLAKDYLNPANSSDSVSSATSGSPNPDFRPLSAAITTTTTAAAPAVPVDDGEREDHSLFGTEETGISVLLRVAGGESNDLSSPLDSKSILFALRTLVHCVCPLPHEKNPELKQEARNLARNNNAVMVLLALLNYKERPVDADPIRYYACDALFGLSLDSEVADILTALHVDWVLTEISNSEVVLAENVSFHSRLKAKALELLNAISHGTSEEIALAADAAARKIARDAIVRRSNVNWNPQELTQLLVDHLESKGLVKSAQTLREEYATLNAPSNNSNLVLPSTTFSWPVKRKTSAPTTTSAAATTTPSHSSKSNASNLPPSSRKRVMDSDTATPSTTTTTSTAIKRLHLSAAGTGEAVVPSTTTSLSVLERIVSDNLRNQHQKCRDPITTLAEFSLTNRDKHVCKTYRPKTAPKDIAKRMQRRMLLPPFGGSQGREINARFFHSKQRLLNHYGRDLHEEVSFMSFREPQGELALGVDTGQIYRFSTNSDKLVGEFDLSSQMEQYEEKIMSSLEFTPNGKQFITETNEGESCMVWNICEEECLPAFHFKDAQNVRLNPMGDSLVCFVKQHAPTPSANPESGVVFYSLETGQALNRFLTSHVSNGYSHKNISLSREEGRMVCYDGVLWDLRMSPNRKIHKFDKLSKFGWSALHPNGYQLLLNKDVWDLRTYRIVHSCSNALNGATFEFDPFGDVIYSFQDHSVRGGDDEILGDEGTLFNSNIVVTDAFDYSNIASHSMNQADVFDLKLHSNGQQFAVLLGKKGDERKECRTYEMGRASPLDDDSDVEDRVEDDDMGSEDEENEDDDDVVLEQEEFEHLLRAMQGNTFHTFGGEEDDFDEEDDGEEDDDENDEDGEFDEEDDDEFEDDF